MIVKNKSLPASVLILVFIAFATISCNRNKTEQTKHIPKDATIVLAVNPAALYGKIKNNKEQLDSLINIFSGKSGNSDSAKQRNEAAKEALDFTKSFYFFAKASNSLTNGKSINVAFVIPIKSKDKFTDFLKLSRKTISISEATGFSYAADSSYAIGWNKNIAILIENDLWNATDSSNKATLNSLFNMKESESVASDTKFTKSFDPKADLSFYANSSQSVSAFSMLALTKASDLVKDVYSAGTINFNEGSVDAKLATYPNKTLSDIVKKNPSEKLSGNTLENFSGTPQLIADFTVNLKQVANAITYMGFDQMINPFLQKQGLSLDDIAAAFTGEIAFAASDFRMEQKPNYYRTSPAFNYILCLPIANKKAYDKIISVLVKLDGSMFSVSGGQFVPTSVVQGGQGFSVNDKHLLIGSSQLIVDNFESGKQKVNLPEDAAKNLKGKTGYFYGDLKSLTNVLPASDASDSALAVLSQKTFKDFSIWGDYPSGNSFTGEAHLHFQNEKENSLITLINYFRQMKIYEDSYSSVPSAISSDSLSSSDSDDMNTNIPIPPNIDTSK